MFFNKPCLWPTFALNGEKYFPIICEFGTSIRIMLVIVFFKPCNRVAWFTDVKLIERWGEYDISEVHSSKKQSPSPTALERDLSYSWEHTDYLRCSVARTALKYFIPGRALPAGNFCLPAPVPSRRPPVNKNPRCFAPGTRLIRGSTRIRTADPLLVRQMLWTSWAMLPLFWDGKYRCFFNWWNKKRKKMNGMKIPCKKVD